MSGPGLIRPRSLRAWLCLVGLAVIGLGLAQCVDKEKGKSGKRFTPPWESDQESLHQLEGYANPQAESLFAVFPEMAAIDSGAGARQLWVYEEGSPDTLRVGHLIDTDFVFPEKPLATFAYAFDETFRDDTLFREAYSRGLYREDHPCAEVWVLTSPFMHPVRWLKSGMTPDEIEAAMGKPSLRHPGALRYLYRDDLETETQDEAVIPSADIGQKVEGVHFYFKDQGLFAAVFQRSRPCH